MFSIRKIQEKSLFPIYSHKVTCKAIRSHNVLNIFGIYYLCSKVIQVCTSEYLAKLENILVRTGSISVYECCKIFLICQAGQVHEQHVPYHIHW